MNPRNKDEDFKEDDLGNEFPLKTDDKSGKIFREFQNTDQLKLFNLFYSAVKAIKEESPDNESSVAPTIYDDPIDEYLIKPKK